VKKALYSRAVRRRDQSPFAEIPTVVGASHRAVQPPAPAYHEEPEPPLLRPVWVWLRGLVTRHERTALLGASGALCASLVAAYALLHHEPRPVTQHDIDAAVQYTMTNRPRPPAETTRAAAIIRPSVVEVEGFLSQEHAAQRAREADAKARLHRAHSEQDGPAPLPDHPLATAPDEEVPDAIGSGVVITEGGAVLTALHVVSSTDRWIIVFADGTRSEAKLISTQPENDLAALQPTTPPDEVQPAVLSSTAGLNPGDTVVATGFPFGIGPSVTSGVVSGLRREFDDPKGHQKFTNLIQFDAAVNPGNSGGPLVNRDGEVVGIVTAILNPTAEGVFVGIGFAVPIENAARALGENPL
jgi:serine protease DegQ